jgi:hypothetical protein
MSNSIDEAAKNARKGTGPAQSPRDSGAAGMMKVGKAGPGGGNPKDLTKLTVSPTSTSRSTTKVGSAGPNVSKRGAQAMTGTTTQKSSGRKK